jgi:hypothetical protein
VFHNYCCLFLLQAKTPPEFIEKAKLIVCNHHELQRTKASLESEIAKLEQGQGQIIAKKERELIDNVIKTSGLSHSEAKALTRRKIDSLLNGKKPASKEPHVSPDTVGIGILDKSHLQMVILSWNQAFENQTFKKSVWATIFLFTI